MASGVLLRRIGQQSLRYISKSYVGVHVNRSCARKLHLSASVLRMCHFNLILNTKHNDPFEGRKINKESDFPWFTDGKSPAWPQSLS